MFRLIVAKKTPSIHSNPVKVVVLRNISTVCFLRSGIWTLNILLSWPSSLIVVCNIFSIYFWFYRCFVSSLIYTDCCWYLLIVADSFCSACKDILRIVVVLFLRLLCVPVGLHYHISGTSLYAWIRIHQLLNQTKKYCCEHARSGSTPETYFPEM